MLHQGNMAEWQGFLVHLSYVLSIGCLWLNLMGGQGCTMNMIFQDRMGSSGWHLGDPIDALGMQIF